MSDDGPKLIMNAIYQRDPTSVVNEIYDAFMSLLYAKGASNKSISNFEQRFVGLLNKSESFGSS